MLKHCPNIQGYHYCDCKGDCQVRKQLNKMTPKEKAQDLFSTYRYALSVPNAPLGQRKDDVAKQCALIAIDEIKQQLIENLSNDISAIHAIYWEKVKQEIRLF